MLCQSKSEPLLINLQIQITSIFKDHNVTQRASAQDEMTSINTYSYHKVASSDPGQHGQRIWVNVDHFPVDGWASHPLKIGNGLKGHGHCIQHIHLFSKDTSWVQPISTYHIIASGSARTHHRCCLCSCHIPFRSFSHFSWCILIVR